MKTIDITTILGSELKSRTSARDFAHVKSVTRSFMDEFYYLLVKNGNAQGMQLEIVNMDEQTQEFLEAVKATADTHRKKVASNDARFLNPATIQQLNEYLRRCSTAYQETKT